MKDLFCIRNKNQKNAQVRLRLFPATCNSEKIISANIMDSEIIRIAKLKGMENWSTWKFQVRITLISNGTWDVVNGTSKLPEQAAGISADTLREINTWKKNDSVAQRIIATSMEEHPLLHIINCETSKAMWDKLTSVYEQKSEASVHMLLQQWYSVTKNSSDDIATHVSRLEDLAHRLQLLGEKIPESMIITKVLMTLPSSYRHFVSAWDSVQTQDRTLANLISRLTIEETRIDGHDKNENKAFAARKQFSKDNNKKFEKSGTCHYCHKPGHWISECRKRKSANAKKESESNKGEVPSCRGSSDSSIEDRKREGQMVHGFGCNRSHVLQPFMV